MTNEEADTETIRLQREKIESLERELDQWKWKCADALEALSSVNLAISEYNVRNSRAIADGSRTI